MSWRPFFLFFLFACSNVVLGASRESRQLASVKELYQFGRGAERDGNWRDALLAYSKILEVDKDTLLEQTARLDIKVRSGLVLLEMGKVAEARHLLEQVRAHELAGALVLQTTLLELQLHRHDGNIMDAYENLLELDAQIARNEWHPRDRAILESVEEQAQDYYRESLEKAERLFDAAAHEEASALYRQVLVYLERNLYADDRAQFTAKVRYRLAQSLFLQDDFPAVIEVLSAQDLATFEQHPELWEIFQNATYLLGRAHRHLSQFHEAIEEYQRYLSFSDVSKLQYATEVTWELGISYFRVGSWSLSAEHLSKVPETRSRLFSLAQLYLGRIALEEKDYMEVEQVLSALSSRLREKDPLRFEIAYLRGEALYQREDVLGASDYFAASLPEKHPEKAPWLTASLNKLFSCYLQLADDPNRNLADQAHYFKQAEATMTQLMELEPSEGHLLELGRLHLAKQLRLKDDDAFDAIEELLGKEHTFTSLEHEVEALLIRSEAAPTFALRQARYRELTHSAYQKSGRHVDSWYYRGISAYEEGRRRLDEGYKAEALMREATEALGHVVKLTKEAPSNWTGLALKYQAEALYTLGGPEEMEEALAICTRLINEQTAIWEALTHPEEVLYLQGVIAANLSNKDEALIEVAEGALRAVYARYPDGHQVDDVLNLLGRLQYQQKRWKDAEQTFVAFGDRFPESPFAGEAWYWAAMAAEKQEKPKAEIDQYRRTVFDLYPTTEQADQVYFHYYTYGEYLQGGEEALAHLQELPNRYPNSPYLVLAHYLIGLDKKRDRQQAMHVIPQDLVAAINSFQAAEEQYHFLLKHELVPEDLQETMVKVRYQARIERSRSELLIAELSEGAKQTIYLDYAEKTFKEVLAELIEPDLAFRKALLGESRYPRLREEAEFGLVQVYRLRGKHEFAAEQLQEMFRSYAEQKITKGYLLSRVWAEHAQLAIDDGEWELALSSLEQAEAAGAGLLSLKDKLQLWLLSAKSNKVLGNYDIAMRLLSQVINEGAPQRMRTEAMYQRAEVYEAMGKTQLTIRQLRACAGKEGVWSEKAKSKLEEYEGYH